MTSLLLGTKGRWLSSIYWRRGRIYIFVCGSIAVGGCIARPELRSQRQKQADWQTDWPSFHLNVLLYHVLQVCVSVLVVSGFCDLHCLVFLTSPWMQFCKHEKRASRAGNGRTDLYRLLVKAYIRKGE